MFKLNSRGFTLIEILIVITVIGILAGITYSTLGPAAKNRSYYGRSVAEMGMISGAVKLYAAKYNDYPADANRGLPLGIEEFLQGRPNGDWPAAPFPGSVYDWDNWPADSYGPQTYQLSIRFCNAGDNATCNANAKKYLKGRVADSVLNSWDAQSAMYYCIRGTCRSHQSQPITHPGLCINCNDPKAQIY